MMSSMVVHEHGRVACGCITKFCTQDGIAPSSVTDLHVALALSVIAVYGPGR